MAARFEHMVHNQILEEELDDSDDDFELTQNEGRSTIETMMLQMNNQFNHELREQKQRQRDQAVQRTLDFLKSVRYLNQHKCYRKYYVLRVFLRGIKPRIWRRIRVPCNISLDMLHDKIMCPLLGWRRNFHAYLFSIPHRADKFVSFGPTKSQSVDMMHISLMTGSLKAGSHMVDSGQVYLSDVLFVKHTSLRYLYDLGDRFHHEIVLEDIEFRFDDTHCFEVALLGGERSGPPENSHGNVGYARTLNEIVSEQDVNRLRELGMGAGMFDPETFDVERCKRRMKRALTAAEETVVTTWWSENVHGRI